MILFGDISNVNRKVPVMNAVASVRRHMTDEFGSFSTTFTAIT